jgi:hypothetical protein
VVRVVVSHEVAVQKLEICQRNEADCLLESKIVEDVVVAWAVVPNRSKQLTLRVQDIHDIAGGRSTLARIYFIF